MSGNLQHSFPLAVPDQIYNGVARNIIQRGYIL